MLKQGDNLTLNDNKEYVVVTTTEYNNKNYVYLISPDDYTNTMICEYDNKDSLQKVTDSELLESLLKIFTNH